jgi:hypothetical protein
MKGIKIVGLSVVGYLLTMQQVFAQVACVPNGHACPVVPEIDGSGAIIGIGLAVGLVALIREKFYNE